MPKPKLENHLSWTIKYWVSPGTVNLDYVLLKIFHCYRKSLESIYMRNEFEGDSNAHNSDGGKGENIDNGGGNEDDIDV